MNPQTTTKQLTEDNIKGFRLEIKQIYAEAINAAEEEFQIGKISQVQFDNAAGELQRLKLLSTKLLGLIMDVRLNKLLNTDTNSPATKIRIATDKLKQAAKEIQKFLDFLESIAEVIRIASGIIVSIQTGAIVKI